VGIPRFLLRISLVKPTPGCLKPLASMVSLMAGWYAVAKVTMVSAACAVPGIDSNVVAMPHTASADATRTASVLVVNFAISESPFIVFWTSPTLAGWAILMPRAGRGSLRENGVRLPAAPGPAGQPVSAVPGGAWNADR
jgi:hypothetical protein